jgi:hypothetical protein
MELHRKVKNMTTEEWGKFIKKHELSDYMMKDGTFSDKLKRMSFLLRMDDMDDDVSDETKKLHTMVLTNTMFKEMSMNDFNKIVHSISPVKMPKSTTAKAKGNCLMMFCRSLLTIARSELDDDEKAAFVAKVNSELPLCRWSSDTMMYLDDEMQIALAPR